MATHEESNILGGHPEDADGIQEYDNALPTWWVGLFIFTIIWGIWIFLDWHVLNDRTLAEQYDQVMANAPAAATFDVASVTLSDDPERIANGQAQFGLYCASCHGADGGGGIGPSFLDSEWLYGSDTASIIAVAANGTNRGMPGWGPALGPETIGDIVAWIRDVNPDLDVLEPDAQAHNDDDDDTALQALPDDDSDTTAGEGTSAPDGVNDHANEPIEHQAGHDDAPNQADDDTPDGTPEP